MGLSVVGRKQESDSGILPLGVDEQRQDAAATMLLVLPLIGRQRGFESFVRWRVGWLLHHLDEVLRGDFDLEAGEETARGGETHGGAKFAGHGNPGAQEAYRAVKVVAFHETGAIVEDFAPDVHL